MLPSGGCSTGHRVERETGVWSAETRERCDITHCMTLTDTVPNAEGKNGTLPTSVSSEAERGHFRTQFSASTSGMDTTFCASSFWTTGLIVGI